MANREITKKDLHYDSIAGEWENFISNYDTDRRIEVLVHDMMKGVLSPSSEVLEVGHGLGGFTAEVLKLRPRSLTSVDISPALVQRLSTRYPEAKFQVADLMELGKSVGEGKFDLVLCTEVIEHTPDPLLGVKNLIASLRPGGQLILSVPNKRWRWLLTIAQALGVRKDYQGYENWVGPNELLTCLQSLGMEIVQKRGVHLIPWHVIPHFVLRALDRLSVPFSYWVSINLAVLARKR